MDAAGHASYGAWWEIIPEPSTPIANFPVSAGNVIHVDITETSVGLWSITIQNQTTGQTFKQSTPYSSTYATAEWIEETPVVIDNSGSVTVGPMPGLSTVNFDLSATNGKPAGLKASEEIQLIDSNRAPLATPSVPDPPDTDGFNVCAFAAACAAPAEQLTREREGRQARRALRDHNREDRVGCRVEGNLMAVGIRGTDVGHELAVT